MTTIPSGETLSPYGPQCWVNLKMIKLCDPQKIAKIELSIIEIGKLFLLISKANISKLQT